MTTSADLNPLNDVKYVFEDPWLLIVHKPAHVAVHADPSNSKTTGRFQFLDLQTHLEEQLQKKLTLYHRLDRETSGLVIFGKDSRIDQAMSLMFEKKQIRKSYLAVVQGRWLPQWNRVENFLRKESDRWSNQSEPPGKEALTTFRLLAATDEKSWIEAIPKTGRTHQIRLHCLDKGRPILGDQLYNPQCDTRVEASTQKFFPQALHAYRLDFKHPQKGSMLRVIDPPPNYWTSNLLNGAGDPATIELMWEKLFSEA